MSNKKVNEENKEVQVDTQIELDKETEVKDNQQTEKKIDNEVKSLKQKLEAEEKVTLLIPYDSLNPDDVVPIGLNGVTYLIPRGKEFQVPKSIKEIWDYSYSNTLKANAKAKQIMNKEIEIL